MRRDPFENVAKIPGNVNPKELVPRQNLHGYWMKVEKRIIDPLNAGYPIIRQRLLFLEPIKYEEYMSTTDRQIKFAHISGFSKMELLWDPTLPGARKIADGALAEEIASRNPGAVTEQKIREAKRKLKGDHPTPGDIQELIDKQ